MEGQAQAIITANQAIISNLISWAGFLLILLIIRSFVVTGLTRAFIVWFESTSDRGREMALRFLVDRNSSAKEAYEILKGHFESPAGAEKKGKAQ